MVSNKTFVILNTLTLAVMLFANFASSAGIFTSVTVADVSHRYDTLFAPAGYAFIIWSVIFLLCIAFVAYQWKLLKDGDQRRYIQRTGIWFSVSNLANTLWIFCWTSQLLGLSVAVILLLLLSLCALMVRLRLELDDEPVRTIFFVWWPLVYYLAWILVATIACIASWLVSLGWHGGAAGEATLTIIMIAVACLLYLFLIRSRNMREAASVGIWAFIAIAVRQWHAHTNIVIAALAASVVLFIAMSVHGYKNRYYGPGAKIKRKEW